ncbi:MAG: Hpt domain-containing protein, partial [Planctomycetales bacterium]|nr:Hpt domain-containing protein [Planctomycetales bacterium]
MTAAGLDPHDEMFGELVADFLDESSQLTERLNENLLELDEWVRSLDDGPEPCDMDLMNEMFRSAHSIKGLSAMLGLQEINHLTHTIENLFDAARREELLLTCESVELVFQGLDRLVGMIDELRDGVTKHDEANDLISQFETVLASAGVEKKQTNQKAAESAMEQITSEQSQVANEAETPIAIEEAMPEVPTEPEVLAPSLAEVKAVFAEIQDEEEPPAKYLAIFIDETDLELDTITETLLGDATDDPKTVEDILILAHRIKGAAASVGLNRAAKLAHLIEDLLQDLREAKLPLPAQLIDPMLKCSDVLRTYVGGLRNGGVDTSSFAETVWELLAANAGGAEGDAAKVAPGDTEVSENSPIIDFGQATEKWRLSVEHMFPANSSLVSGVALFQRDLPLVGMKAQLILDRLAAHGEVLLTEPKADQIEDLEEITLLQWAMVTDAAVDELRLQLQIAGVEQIDLYAFAKSDAEQAALTPSRREDVLVPNAETALVRVAEPDSPEVEPAPSPTPSPMSSKVADSKRAPAPSPATPARAVNKRTVEAAKPAASKPAETLRVDIERLDQLMNLAGQLVINRARFSRIGDGIKGALSSYNPTMQLMSTCRAFEKLESEFEDAASGGQGNLDAMRSQVARMHADLQSVRENLDGFVAARAQVEDLLDAVHQLTRVSDGIQQAIMDTRMVPVGPLFTRFRRVVRDISRSNGKEIDLVIHGEKTELDKRMIDELGDPLIHMVRNSADHGIESPEDRVAAGKPRAGKITL